MTPPSAWAAAVEAMEAALTVRCEHMGACDCAPDGLRAALPHLLRAADTEDAEGACFVQKVHDDTWELWCANPGVGAQPVGSYRLASFGTYAECRAVCNALNRVLARALTASAEQLTDAAARLDVVTPEPHIGPHA